MYDRDMKLAEKEQRKVTREDIDYKGNKNNKFLNV